MRTADFHCDVLAKMLTDETVDFGQRGNGPLDVTYERLLQANSVFQTFAIYIPSSCESNAGSLLRSIDLFYRRVIPHPQIELIQTSADLQRTLTNGKIGAMLSLEGADALQGDFTLLRILYYLGVRALGLTWNEANWAADGVMEPRQGGLSSKGVQLVAECNRLGIMLDVSHLTDQGFWEVLGLTRKPVIASHSNARALCSHPRNLSDDQISALIAADGRIGITYVPWFVEEQEPATIDDLLRHIEHICSLGGQHHLMLGSDFDGIDRHVQGLRHPAEVYQVTEALLRRYDQSLVAGIMSDNAIRFLLAHLPK
ncbi:membrane dipeptidase [Paenibacillaceae bacterium]|nr:membrane dipeptidase [Paenibacillaceae bacterium]